MITLKNVSPYAPLFMSYWIILFSYYSYSNIVFNHPDTWRIWVSGLGFSIFFIMTIWATFAIEEQQAASK